MVGPMLSSSSQTIQNALAKKRFETSKFLRPLSLLPRLILAFLAADSACSGEVTGRTMVASTPALGGSGELLNALFGCTLALIILILLWKSAHVIKDFAVRHYRSVFAASSLESWPKKLVEEEELSKLAICTPPTTEPKSPKAGAENKIAAAASQDASNANAVISTRALLDDFASDAPATFVNLATLCDKIKQKTREPELREELTKICSQLQNLKSGSALPQLRVVWQMTSAIEGLLKQLDNRITYVTPSTLRTLSKSLELLREFCATKAASETLTTPAIRILGVDDDPISRYALSWAIKKAFNQVDVVENGEAALKLANQHAYDAIFLDIRMPGMDGFELCANIRTISLNRTTPVVFVTAMRDFDSRLETVAKENDLIAKPFLGFEITVKVLTLALRKRLDQLKKVE